MKKITSFVMSVIMLITCLSSVTISYASDNDCDFNDNETIIIDGITYKFEYSYLDGEKITRIVNLTDNTEDILYYNKEKKTIFLNDAPVAFVQDIPSEQAVVPFANKNNRWVYYVTTNKRISWAMGTSVAVVAGVIAAVIPGASAKTIFARIGVGTLGILAGSSNGGIVEIREYRRVLMNEKVEFRFDWSFYAQTGDVYGPFSTYLL